MTATDALSGVENAWSPEVAIEDNESIALDPLGSNIYGGSWESDGANPGHYDVDFEAWDLAGNRQRGWYGFSP